MKITLSKSQWQMIGNKAGWVTSSEQHKCQMCGEKGRSSRDVEGFGVYCRPCFEDRIEDLEKEELVAAEKKWKASTKKYTGEKG